MAVEHIQIVFFVISLIFIIWEIFKINGISDSQDKRNLYLSLLFLLIGVLVRIVNLDYMAGVNPDEAMAGYESWCLANYGVDSHMVSYPVYMKVWGSGMSALYIYMAMPFVKIFGLSEEVFRLPMSFLGAFAVMFFYWTLRKTQKDTLLVCVLSSFIAITPWHIMKSRYGLDAMVAPDLILIGVCCFMLGYTFYSGWKQTAAYCTGFAILAISAYGYAVSWVVLPILVILIILFLYKQKAITPKQIGTGIALMFIIAWPLMYFAGILYLGFDEMKVGAMTIPKLDFNRANDTGTFILASDNILSEIKNSIPVISKLFLLGTDGISNEIAMPYFGIYYNIVALPFLAYGIWSFLKEKRSEMYLLFIMFASSCILLVLVGASLVHWNLLWLPLAIFTGYGIYYFAKSFAPCKGLFLSMFSILFLLFLINYFNFKTFKPGFTYYARMIKESTLFVKDKKFDRIYYPHDIVHSIVLFYNPINPRTFDTTVKREGVSIQLANEYANVTFGLPADIVPKKGTAYIVSNKMVPSINLEGFKTNTDSNYTVLWSE